MNRLIAFEGIDNVGKTTLSRALTSFLKKKEIPAVRYEDIEEKEKGFNVIKDFIRREVSIEASLLFYLASAVYKSENIENLLKKGWVICDRYIDSTLAYHEARGSKILEQLNLFNLPIKIPDVTFLVVVEESIRVVRGRSRENPTAQDALSKKDSPLIETTERLLNRPGTVIINNIGSIEDSLEKVIRELVNRGLLD